MGTEFGGYIRNKIIATQRLLEALRGSVARFVFASSSSVYGDDERLPTSEDFVPEPSQPPSNEDDSIWVTQNGEIHNYIELRDELATYGHVFRTKGDTGGMAASTRTQLPLASMLVWEGGEPRISPYWSAYYTLTRMTTVREDIEECLELLEDRLELLRGSIRLRLRSDVPVSVFLSGGMDCRVVTALIVEQSERPVHTHYAERATSMQEHRDLKQLAASTGVPERNPWLETFQTPWSDLTDATLDEQGHGKE